MKPHHRRLLALFALAALLGRPAAVPAAPADGKTLVSSHQDGVYRVWDPATAKEVRQLTIPKAPNYNASFFGRVRFTPDDKGLATVGDWAVRVLDAENGKELRWYGGHTAAVTA